MNNEKRHSRKGPGRVGFGRGHGMAMPVEKPKDFKGTLKRLSGYFKPHKIKLLTVILAAILSTLFGIISPKVLGKIITELFEGMMTQMKGIEGPGVDFDYVLRTVFILAGLYLFSAAFAYVRQFIMARVSQKTVMHMREDISNKLARLPLKFYDSKSHGDTLSRVINDVDNISRTLQQSITQLITAVVTIVGVVIMMLTISPLMTLITILTLPLYIFVTKPIIKRSQRYFKKQQKTLGELNGHVEEMYTGHKIIKAFGHEKRSIAKFEKVNENLYDAGWKAQFMSGIIMPLMMLINNMGYIIISVVGSVMVIKRTIEVGDVQAFIQYARQFTRPITQIANISNIIQSTIASAERVFELLDEEEEPAETKEDKVIEDLKGNVMFDSVKFGYEKDVTVIKHLNIDVKKGQTVAIVGPTGAGKTTLVNLLMRFYDIDEGKITIDGTDIRDMKRGNLRNIFGMVLQDTWLFKGTIRDNIAYGRENVTEDEIVKAAEAAHVDHFIRTLTDGYDTVLNEEASNISQGQKQLITIARAVLADPAILILDEATSSVDTRTEILIQNAMNNLMKERTNFVIAHRLSTIRNADIILVMNEGDIIEKGTHEELLEMKGFYADLYNSQFTGAVGA